MEWWRRKEYANQYANESNYSQQHLSNSYFFLNGPQSFFKKLVFFKKNVVLFFTFYILTIIEVLTVPKIKTGFISSERPLHFIPKAW